MENCSTSKAINIQHLFQVTCGLTVVRYVVVLLYLYSLLDDRVLYVTSVRRGYVTAGSVSPLMPVFVLSLMLFVWSVTEIHGDTVCTDIATSTYLVFYVC